MLRWPAVVFLVFLVVVPSSAQVRAAQLKNAEADLLCVYWKVELPGAGPVGLAELLPLGPGFQRLAPDETARIDLAVDQGLVVVFVPWTRSLHLRTPVSGVVVRSSELFSGKQFALRSDALWSTHPSDRLNSALADWGLNVPRFVLDGAGSDWESVPVTARWSPKSARPGQPLRLQMRVADQALWFFAELAPAAAAPTASWVLRAQGVFWELFPGGTNSRIWQFSPEANTGNPVGWRVLAQNRLEAWIPLERLTTNLLAAGSWQLRLVSGGENPDNFLLLDVNMGDLP